MKKTAFSSLLFLGIHTLLHAQTPITEITTNPLPDAAGNTEITSAGKILNSLTSGGLTYTEFDLIDRHEFLPAIVAFYAWDGANGVVPDFGTIYTTFELTNGLANSTGNFFFNTSYDSDDLIFLMEIGGQDNISIALIDSTGLIISDPIEYQITEDTGYDLRFRTTNSTTNNVLQDIVGITLSEADFTNITGTAAGINIANAGGNTNGVDLITLGTISQVPTVSDPEIAPVSGIDFGTLSPADVPADAPILVNNDGPTIDLTISNLAITGPDASHFSVIGTPGPIGPGGDGEIEIQFSPGALTGSFSATLSFDTNDPDEPSFSLALAALVNSDPEIDHPASVDLGTYPQSGLPATNNITIQNFGATNNLNLSNVTFSGTDAALFGIDIAPVAIAPGGQDNFVINFDSANAGTFTANLDFNSDDRDEPLISIPLTITVNPTTITAVNTTVDLSGFEVLESVTSSSLGTIPANQLTNVNVFSFNNGDGVTGNASVMVNVGGSFDLPDPRQALLEDNNLNTGLINPGEGSPVVAGDLIDDSRIGMGVRFNGAIPNGPGTDALFFELSVNEATIQTADPVTIALLDATDMVIGSEVAYTPTDFALNTGMSDPTVVSVSPLPATLNDLNTNLVADGNTVNAFYNLLEIDFSDFGIEEGTQVNGLFIRGADIDPVFIGGLRGSGAPVDAQITSYTFDDSSLTITFDSTSGSAYGIETSTDLQNWIEIEDHTATSSSSTVTVPLSAEKTLFYRVIRN